jgi:hypothetical protein
MKSLKDARQENIRQQEKQGGFVLWALSTSPEQDEKIIKILLEYGAEHIEMHEDHPAV